MTDLNEASVAELIGQMRRSPGAIMTAADKRMPWPSDPPDSLGKLTEALAECGVPQRDWATDEAIAPDYIVLGLGVRFQANDREGSNLAQRELIAFAARSLYAHLATLWDDVNLEGAQDRFLVWRVRPEVTEDITYEYVAPDGTIVDPGAVESDRRPLRAIYTGDVRLANFYARFWIESAGQPQKEPA